MTPPADRLAEIANRTPRLHPDIWIEAHGPAVCLTRAEHEWILAELARVTAENAKLREALAESRRE